MDEYNSGMDPEVKAYFRKIMNSFSLGLLWLLAMMTLGLFFGLGYSHTGLKWYNLLFYFFLLLTLSGLLYYYRKVWGDK